MNSATNNFIMCKPVINIKFGSYSKTALEDINRQLSYSQIGDLLLMSAIFYEIFTKFSSLKVAVNVGTADWEGIT